MATITITLPDDLAERAKARGLLTPEAIEGFVLDGILEEEGTPLPGSMSDEDFEELMNFGKNHNITLGGMTLKEFMQEARRG